MMVGGLLGLVGCASNPPGISGLQPDATTDGSANGCAANCAAKGQSCSFGRCTSFACYTAELTSNTAVGCLFYTLQADNVTADEAAGTTFLVTGQGPDPANVELQQWTSNGGAPAWTAIATTIAGSGASARLPISAAEVTATGLTPQAALRISSDRPITVAEVESDDLSVPATSSGGTMILPLQALGTDYRAVAYPQQTSPDIENTVGSRGGAARVIVVGTHAGTQVTLTPAGAGSAAADGGAGLDAGTSTVVLGDGDVFQIYTGMEGDDLTGMHISSLGGPVAVFSGNISTTYGSQVVGINSADMAHEQMPPIPTWSTSYVAAALTPQQSIDCTSFFGAAGGSIWRVVAAKDGTVVTLSGPAIGPTPAKIPLDAGESESFVEVGSFAVDANAGHPVLVTQGIDCEASLSLAIAVGGGAQLYQDLPFAVPPGFDLLLGIVRHTGVEVDLDGADLGDAPFETVSADYEVAAVPLPACAPTDGSGVCTHRLQSRLGVGMSLRGMDVRSSAVLTVPVLVRCDPTTGSCLS